MARKPLMDPQHDQRRWVLAALDEFELPLLRYALRLLRNADAARDVVQHVFLQLCDRKAEEIDGPLAAWLYTVCRNRALDVLRAGQRQKSLESSRQQNGASRVECRERDPACAVEQTDLNDWLRSIVGRLPASQCEAIGLWAEGLTYREIAQIVERHEGHVRVLVHRGLKSLRENPQVRQMMNLDVSAGQLTERMSPEQTLG